MFLSRKEDDCEDYVCSITPASFFRLFFSIFLSCEKVSPSNSVFLLICGKVWFVISGATVLFSRKQEESEDYFWLHHACFSFRFFFSFLLPAKTFLRRILFYFFADFWWCLVRYRKCTGVFSRKGMSVRIILLHHVCFSFCLFFSFFFPVKIFLRAIAFFLLICVKVSRVIARVMAFFFAEEGWEWGLFFPITPASVFVSFRFLRVRCDWSLRPDLPK